MAFCTLTAPGLVHPPRNRVALASTTPNFALMVVNFLFLFLNLSDHSNPKGADTCKFLQKIGNSHHFLMVTLRSSRERKNLLSRFVAILFKNESMYFLSLMKNSSFTAFKILKGGNPEEKIINN
jgi:hypothetical protein